MTDYYSETQKKQKDIIAQLKEYSYYTWGNILKESSGIHRGRYKSQLKVYWPGMTLPLNINYREELKQSVYTPTYFSQSDNNPYDKKSKVFDHNEIREIVKEEVREELGSLNINEQFNSFFERLENILTNLLSRKMLSFEKNSEEISPLEPIHFNNKDDKTKALKLLFRTNSHFRFLPGNYLNISDESRNILNLNDIKFDDVNEKEFREILDKNSPKAKALHREAKKHFFEKYSDIDNNS